MPDQQNNASTPLSRRDFLALATAGAAAAAWPDRLAGQDSGAQGAPLDTGGIAMPNFEAAQKRAADLVAKMTLEEKISQFGVKVPALPHLNLAAFNFYASEALHGLDHIGPVTSFPLPLALGCSWNRELIEQVFTAVSDEIWAWHKKTGMSQAMFSPPTVNMGARDPRWGRIAENYSEDPYLAGQMAIDTIRGMQGHDSRFLKTIACAKHYIGNDTEDDRHVTSASIDPRSFWEYYSRGFEICVREGRVFTVMSSYNALNGVPTSASSFLLTDVLRGRWGFRGYVVSDCGAVGDICRTHHFVPAYPEAAALAVNAGCDINCGATPQKYLGQAVEEMLISESALDRSLIRSITGRILLGDLDPPEQNPYNQIPVACLESPAHRQSALEAARQSIVLFKNENRSLPLDKGQLKRIAVIGPMADVCYLGNYSGMPWHRVSPLAGLRNYLGATPAPSYQKRADQFFSAGPGEGEARKGGTARWYLRPRLEPHPDGGQNFFGIENGAWAAYRDVIFNGATKIEARVASATAGGSIEVYLGNLAGPQVAKLRVPNTGGWDKWITVSAPLQPLDGEHAVYLRFSGGAGDLFKFLSFRLSPEAQVGPPSGGAAEVVYAMGCTVTGEKDPSQFAKAVKAAREADIALLFLGADEQVDREGHDRDSIGLPGAQHELAQAVYAANPRTILVISSNCPVAVNWEQANLPAILGGMFLGQMQGDALAQVLFGDYNPGGKLTTTWYRDARDLPDFHDYNIRHGRTYMYFRGNPLYPFGHGLSYTRFQYKNLRLSGGVLRPGGKIEIQFDVTNTGGREGVEIAQLYVHFAGGTAERPIKQLVNFQRLQIKAGETKTASFELDAEERAFRYWDESRYDFVAEAGTIEITAGASSADIRLQTHVQLAV